MRQRIVISALFVLLIGIFWANAASAQGATGVVKGQVVDAASGTAVAGVSVAISENRTGLARSVTTNASGRFHLQLRPGVFTLRSSGSGYTTVSIEQVVVNIGAAVELTIPVAADTIEEVVVYGTAVPLMKTATGETGLHISLEELSRMPVPRNIEDVALMAPDTVPGIHAFGDDKTLVSFGG
ncbi:MAG: carboxypeptidase-like regulatory domain-containing protein, partial [Gammaproteobacteria bacterium]|nr:carboxypeptidase-like regulatory domain-containing protein [Gammaproteobacteria bacterium]